MKEVLKDTLTKKEDLLKEICKAYGYELEFSDERVFCYDDIEDETSHYIYDNIDTALIDWLPSLIDSELDYRKNNDEITWINEIEFIKNIRDEVMFNKDSKILENALIYGSVPILLNKRLSVILDEQNKRVDTFINEYNTDLEMRKINMPVEFIVKNSIVKDKELSFVKIPNKEFFTRLIKGDTSEIEFEEMDVFDKNGIVNIMPLLPINKIEKFSLNIPLILIKSDSGFKITQKPNYLQLF